MKQKILLDQHFKNILRNKLILAYIMKDNLDEYANSSIGEIMKCIEPQGDVPLHTHLISGHRNENNEDDVSVVFDSLVYASLPHDDKRKIAMIINLEAQGELKGKSHGSTGRVEREKSCLKQSQLLQFPQCIDAGGGSV